MSLKVYRGRTLARSQALQLLFQAEATDSPLERVLEGGHELQEVKGVGAEVLEAGLLGELGAIGDVQRVIDDLDDLLKNGVTVHGSSLDGARAPGKLS